MLALVADIGGTNARFALTDLKAKSPVILHEQSLPAADFASLQHAAEHYLSGVHSQPKLAAIAVASPVSGDEIRLTNRAWSFSQRELKVALKLEKLTVLNDFGAVAHAVASVQFRSPKPREPGEQRQRLRDPLEPIPQCGIVHRLAQQGAELRLQLSAGT